MLDSDSGVIMVATAGGAALPCRVQRTVTPRPRTEIAALLTQPFVRLDHVLPVLCAGLAEWGPRHALDLDLDPVLLPSDDAVKVAAIATEAVLNAAIHGRPRESKHHTVEVNLTLMGRGLARLEVKDNGPGLPRTPPRPRRSRSGIALIRTLSARLGGSCWLENDGGVRFVLTFPVATAEAGRAAQ